MVSTPANHMPIGSLDCNGSGCHTTENVNPGGFKIGSASISAPTLNVAGHTTVATAVSGCQTCHESAPYVGMLASTATAAGDSRPTALRQERIPTSGDCNGCHTSTPTFAANVTRRESPRTTYPTTAACTQCHTTAGNYAVYSVTGTHQGVTTCLSCHGADAGVCQHHDRRQAGQSHADRCLDCNGSGCHRTTNVNPGGFKLGAASINTPTLSIAGHDTIAAAYPRARPVTRRRPTSACSPARRPRPAIRARRASTRRIRPAATAMAAIPRTPTFAADVTAVGKAREPHPDHRSVRAVPYHGGQLRDLFGHRHSPGRDELPELSRPRTLARLPTSRSSTTPANHIPIGSLDCNGSGCHTTTNVNAGGFKLGTASISTPTLSVAGHATVAAAVPACATCHESGALRRDAAEHRHGGGGFAPDGVRLEASDHRGLRQLSRHDAHLRDRSVPTATKPANHIPTNAPCAQCHTTAGNYALYSVTGTHQGVTNCLSCHGPTVGPFAQRHDGQHAGQSHPDRQPRLQRLRLPQHRNVNPGGFKIGTARFPLRP